LACISIRRVTFNLGVATDKQTIGESAELYYLRCRFASGAYDAAPVLRALIVNGALAEQTAATGEAAVFASKSGAETLEAETLASAMARPHSRCRLLTRR
jgi:hypothetical protein